MQDRLPIEGVLSEIGAALQAANRLVLAAPPGAGKTTGVPLALLDHPACGAGRILVLEPRRIAARLASERMAAMLGEPLGRTVGLSTRVERRVSKATRIEVITDGLFTRRLLADPSLDGVSAVLFDEIHERGVSSDLGLALARDAQGALREDLRLVAMSATLDTARMAAALDCQVVESEGRAFEVVTRYLGRTRAPPGEQVAKAVRKAVSETDGSVLAFLPGAAEIRRAAGALDGLPGDVAVHALFGALSPREQDAAVRPAPAGGRKVVLATDIAESSLTIEGVTVVVDAGLARVPVYDPTGGATRLETVRASRASVDQRRGRAGRTAPGVCYRLWDEEETRGLPADRTPEILVADLSGLRLALAEWGERDAARLPWLDPPPEGRLAAAEAQLVGLGALTADGVLTGLGRDMAALPLEPRLAALVAGAPAGPEKALAAQIAAIAGERGLGGTSPDLDARLAGFARDGSARAAALKRQAAHWAGGAAPAGDAGALLARAWPDRIARRRRGDEGVYLLGSGQAARLDADSSLAKSEWLAVADLAGGGSGARIALAAPLTEADAKRLGGVQTVETAEFDVDSGAVKARRVTRLGAITLSEAPLKRPSGETARAAVLEAVRRDGLGVIGAEAVAVATLARIALIKTHTDDAWPDWSLEGLAREAEDWLGPLVASGDRLLPDETKVSDALLARLDWPLSQRLKEGAPLKLALPSGRAAPVSYLGEQAPLVEARVQEVFGPGAHPCVAFGRCPVTVSLLSPGGRQVALTKDLPGFWTGGYRDMAKDMRARYPKHDWPADPASARPHEGRTKARL